MGYWSPSDIAQFSNPKLADKAPYNETPLRLNKTQSSSTLATTYVKESPSTPKQKKYMAAPDGLGLIEVKNQPMEIQ